MMKGYGQVCVMMSWVETHGLERMFSTSLALNIIPPFKRYCINQSNIGKSQVIMQKSGT